MIKILMKVAILALFVVCALPVLAQTGPGGVGNTSGTSGQPTNVMWFQPSGFTNTGGFVSAWSDESGNANSITQGTTTHRPSITPSAGGFNYAEFDGTDDRLPFDGSLLANTQYTVFTVVGRRGSERSITNSGIIMGGSTASGNQNLHPFFANDTRIDFNQWGNDYNTTISPALTAGADKFGIFTFRLNSSNRSIFQNGGHLANGGNGTQLSSFDGAHLGFRGTGDGSAGAIDLAEFIVFQNTLNDAQVLIVSNYLSAKYNLPMSGTDLYAGHDAAYINDLVGIGSLSGNGGGVDGSHAAAQSKALYLSGGDSFLNGDFVMLAHANGGNSSSTADITGSVEGRWERDWFLDKTGAPATTTIDFAFQEVSGGQYPGEVSNYVLLYRAGTSGNYTEVTTVSGPSFAGTDRISFDVSNANLADGYYTIGTTDEANSPILGELPTTFYTYSSGDWSDPFTWTLDPSGTDYNNSSALTPASSEVSKVVILNGDEVTMTGNNYQNSFVEIKAGGILNLAATSGHNFGEIRGNGFIKTQSPDNFPSFNEASDFQQNGTFEITGTGGSLTSASSTGIFNNLKINLASTSDVFTMLTDITLNGDLLIQQGIFRINDNTSTARLDLTVKGNVTVETNGLIRVGQGNTLANDIGGTQPYRIGLDANLAYNSGLTQLPDNIDYFNMYHRVGIFGDFVNNGSVRFTNQDKPNYGALAGQTDLYGQSDAGSVAAGAATVSFRGESNNTLTCNGTTDFYQLMLNKGSNKNYKLSLNASEPQYFNLYGPNRLGGVNNGTASIGALGDYTCNNSGQAMEMKALCLLNGTLEVKGKTIILCMTNSGGGGNINTDYYIPSTASLWVNSSNAEVYVTIDADNNSPYTADDFVNIANHLPSAYAGTPQNQLPNTSVGGINYYYGSGSSALSVYGEVKVSAGILCTRNSAGFIYWPTAAGTIVVEGGFVDASVFRPTNSSTGTASVSITGGKVTLRGRGGYNSLDGEVSNDYAIFSIPNSENSFSMTGGEIDIQETSGVGSFIVGSSATNVNVTGGSITINNDGRNRARVSSTAPFYNLTFTSTTNSTNTAHSIFLEEMTVNGVYFPAQDLKVLNNLTLETGTLRTVGSSTYGTMVDLCPSGNCVDLEVGGDLTINSSAVLDVFSGDTDNANSATVTFNGAEDATLFIGDITAIKTALVGYVDPEGEEAFQRWEYPFYNFIVDKPSDKTLLLYTPNTYTGSGNVYKNGSGAKNINSWRNNLVKVFNDLTLESGRIDLNLFSIRAYGAITNKGVLGIDAVPVNAQLKTRKENSPVTRIITTTDGAEFGNIRLNSGESILKFTSDVYIKYLEYKHGRLDIGTHNLKIDVLAPRLEGGDVVGNDFGVQDMIIMSGNASDGGLTLYVPSDINPGGTSGNPSRNARDYLFPIGTGSTNIYPGSQYTPLKIRMASGGFTDDGYITVSLATSQLQTTGNPSLVDEQLNRYWKVSHSGFGTVPKVTFVRATATEVDIPDGTNDDEMVDDGGQTWSPGWVLDELPYTRNYELNNGATSGSGFKNNGSSEINIYFYGDLGPGFAGNPSGGFDLVNANYTSGLSTKFVGQPFVYYTKGRDRTGTQPLWTNANTWTRSDLSGFDSSNPHKSDNPDAPSVPGVGDIAIIGFFPYDDPQTDYRGYPHSARINGGDLQAAKLIFTPMTESDGSRPAIRKPLSEINTSSNQFQFRPTLVWNSTGSIEVSQIEGEGTIRVRGGSTNINHRDPSFAAVDMGGFASEDSSYLLYEAFNDYTITNIPDEVPNLMISADSWGANNRTVTLEKDFTINQNFEILGNSNVILGNGVSGDITVKGNLHLKPLTTNVGGGELRFQETGTGRNMVVEGNVYVGNPSGAAATGGSLIHVTAGGAVTHTMQVNGDVVINTTGNNTTVAANGLVFGGDGESNIDLTLGGANTKAFSIVNGNNPEFHKISLNKGTSTASSFTFNNNFTLTGVTNTADKAIEIVNGLMVLNHPSIDVTLSSGGGDFQLPNLSNVDASSGSGGLEVQQGTVRVSGDDTGIILDGLLRVSNTGVVDMDDTGGNGNNFIQYGSTANAIIEVQDNGVLTVGSQIRGQEGNELGALKYRQTGGTVVVGKNAAPLSSKGVFEVLFNIGTEFVHTGGTLRVSRANGASPTRAAFYLRPITMSTIGTGTIIFGDDAVVSAETILVDVEDNGNTRVFNNLTIDGGSSTTVKLSTDMAVEGNFEIQSDASLNANGKAIRFNGDTFTDNGTYTANANVFTFSGGTQVIAGTSQTPFYDLVINPTVSVTPSSNSLVSNDLTISSGVFALGNNEVTVNRHLINNSSYTAAAGKVILTGSAVPHQVSGSGIFGTLEIDNAAEGALVGSDLTFNGNLQLRNGLLVIENHLLTLNTNAIVEALGTSFSATKMIRTNVVTSDESVRKLFSNGYTGSFVYPVGIVSGGNELYTPVTVTFTSLSGVKSLTVVPVGGATPSAENATDVNLAPRVVNFYWKLFDSSPSTASEGTLLFGYDDLLVENASDEVNYIPVRLQGTSWSKFPDTDVDESANTISFNFTAADLGTDNTTGNATGTSYSAGLASDFPDQIPYYRYAATTGNWDEVSNWQRSDDGGVTYGSFGVNIPTKGPSGQVVVIPTGSVVNLEGGDTPVNKFAFRKPYQVIFEGGELVVGDTRGNSLGILTIGSGHTGILTIGGSERAQVPAGDLSNFLADPNSTVTFTGNIDYTLDASVITSANLVISGGGTKTIPNGALNVSKNLTIASGTILDNTVNNSAINIGEDFTLEGEIKMGSGNLDVNGDLTFESTSTFTQGSNTVINVSGDLQRVSGASGGTTTTSLVLDGSSVQSISGTGMTFKDVTINNAAGVNVNQTGGEQFKVTSNLNLTNGLVNTSGSETTSNLVLDGAVTITGASSSNYINGPLRVESLGTGALYEFPVGNGGRYGAVSVNPTCSSGNWTVNYRNSNPQSDLGSALSSSITDVFPNGGISQNEYWTIDGPSPCTANVQIRWDGISNVGSEASQRAQLKLAIWSGTEWEFSSSSPTIDDSGNTLLDNVSFSTKNITFGTGDVDANPLPVELLYFTGKSTLNGVDLEWATASETNNDYFEVQRSYNGKDFETVAQVDGVGNSFVVNTYTYQDKEAPSADLYYRLKQVDFDGTAELHPVIFISKDNDIAGKGKVNVYPNPISDAEQLSLLLPARATHISIQVVSLDGNIISESSLNSEVARNIWNLDVSNHLSKGVYFILIQTEHGVYRQRLLKK